MKSLPARQGAIPAARVKPVSAAIRRAMLSATLVVGMAAVPAGADAIGFGKSELRSGLGQPLDVRAEVALEPTESIPADSLLAEIPDTWEHAERGRDAVGTRGLRPKVVVSPEGKTHVQVVSDRPFNEPAVNFLLRLSWPTGEIIQEYSLLLDPVPVAAPVTQAQSAAAAVAPSAPAPAARAPVQLGTGAASISNLDSGGRRYGPVAPGDTLGRILRSNYPGLNNLSRAAQIVANSLECRCWLREAEVLKNPFDALMCSSSSEEESDEEQ